MKLKTDEDDKVVRDGQSVSLPVTLMDGVQREVASDAIAIKQRIADAHSKYRTDVSNRWRAGPRGAQTPSPMLTPPAVTPDAETAYAAYDHAIANRWRKTC